MESLPSHARPGVRNLITDVPGLKVGQAQDEGARSGVTVILPNDRAVCAVDVRGGAPGTRETDALAPENLVEAVDAVAGLVVSAESRRQAIVTLGVMLQAESSTEVKVAILTALSNLRTPEAVDAIATQLDREQPFEVRTAAVDALVRMDDRRALPALEALAADQDPEIQAAAREAVQELNTPSPTALFTGPAVAADIHQPRSTQKIHHSKGAPVSDAQIPAP